MAAKFIYFNAARNFNDTIFMYAQFKNLLSSLFFHGFSLNEVILWF